MSKTPKKRTPRTNKLQHNKKELIAAMEKSLGIVTTACKSVGLDRSTFYSYYKTDPEFKAAVDDVENIALDFAESQFHKQIQGGNPTSTIFYLKTKGKKRGYIEQQQVEHFGKDGGPIESTNSVVVLQGVDGDDKEK